MKIAITGGHITPALSVIDYSRSNNSSDEIVFFGRLYSQANDGQKAVEKIEVEKRGVRFIPFSAPRLVNSSLIKKAQTVFFSIISVFNAWKLLRKEKPDVFLSFGGYLAVPFAVASWILGIPVVTHEQTRAAGMANTLIAKFATSVAVSFESSKKYFKKVNVSVTGNPIRKSIFKSYNKPEWMSKQNIKPILLVVGGNQGSLTINNVIKELLSDLLPDWLVVHQCGRPTKDHHYKNELLSELDTLDKKHHDSYIVMEWISEQDLSWLYHNATLAVSRSGINSVQELAMMSVPAIFIPLPFAYMDEQQINAQWLVDNNGAVLLLQDELSPKTLLSEIKTVKSKISDMKENLSRLKIERNADKNLYELVKKVAHE